MPAGALAFGVPAEIREGAVEEGRYRAGVQRYVDLAARGRELRRIDAFSLEAAPARLVTRRR